MNIAIELDCQTNRICWSNNSEIFILSQSFSQPLKWEDNEQLFWRLKTLLNTLPSHVDSNQIIITAPNFLNPIIHKKLYSYGEILGFKVIRVLLITTTAAFYLMSKYTTDNDLKLFYTPLTDGISWGLYEQTRLSGEYFFEVLKTGYVKSSLEMHQDFLKNEHAEYCNESIEIKDTNASILGALMLARVLDGKVTDNLLVNASYWTFGILANQVKEYYVCKKSNMKH